MTDKYELNQKIWHIEINKYADSRNSYSFRKNGIIINELEIIGISPYRLCLNNDFFTTLSYERDGHRKDKSIYIYPDDISVNIRTNGSVLGDGIFITLYSTKKPTKKTLYKMVAKASLEIKKTYGFLSSMSEDIYDTVDEFCAEK